MTKNKCTVMNESASADGSGRGIFDFRKETINAENKKIQKNILLSACDMGIMVPANDDPYSGLSR